MVNGGFMYGGAGRSSNTTKGYSNVFNAGREPFSEKSPFDRGMYFAPGQRRRLNAVAIGISLFMPWLLFSIVFGLLSFNLHYKQPQITNVLILIAFGVVVLSGYYAAKAMKNRFTEPGYQPSWYIFIAVTSLIAFVLALIVGSWNYVECMKPYYDLMNLAEYRDIDTNAFLGEQIMDAGRINFKPGTGLTLPLSMGFKSHDVYCVAPISTKDVNGSPSNPSDFSKSGQSIDFWAVGKNCCSGVAADFHCSGFSDPNAKGVIRAMHDEDRPFYRLAVQQAEATYKIKANHPLFFHWVHDADEATEAYANKGWRHYWFGIATHFLLQFFLTGVCALAFSKLVHL